jgi:hypothetical protein
MILYCNMMFHKNISNTERIIYIKNILLCFCLLTLVFLYSSCEQDVNIEIKTNDKRLLVDGEFTDETVVHSIRLYCSGSLITGRPQTSVSGAKIYVTDGIETVDYIENIDTPGLYQTTVKVGGKGGHRYTLSITNIDIDNDGKIDSYKANGLMPVPVKFDSMASYYGLNGDNIEGTVSNSGYYTTFYNGPDYLYDYFIVNSKDFYTLTDRLGTGELTRNELEFRTIKVNTPGSIAHGITYSSIEPRDTKVKEGDTICIVGLNFNKDQYEFLKEYDNNTTSNNPFIDNIYDQLKIPANLPTNIEPADKAAGYFFIYSVSKISKVFNE